jgi:hypothetical protein
MPERLRNFNPLTLQLTWSFHRWQLVADGELLKDFGTHEQEARHALRLIRELGLNQYGTVGAPLPVMEYWLIDGQTPQGLVRGGLRALPLVPATMRVEQFGGQWCLRDSTRVLFTFGSRQEEARQALAILRKHGFTQVGTLGIGAPLMYVFFGTGQANAPALSSAAPRSLSAGHLAAPRFSRVAKNADGSPHVEKTGAPPVSVEGVVSAVVPPLAVPSAAAKQAAPWREHPHSGPRSDQASDGDHMAFDWRQAQLRVERGEWRLMAGTAVLASFGGNATEARLALSALRYYRFTEQWKAGAEAHDSCYLASKQSPRGTLFGLRTTEIDPQKVEVKQSGGGYEVVAGREVLAHFGSHREEAGRLAEAIRKEGLDRQCKLGEPGKEAMTLLLRSH